MAMNQLPIGVAFLAGVLSFLSPCLLPLVPGYISFISGVSLEELRRGANRADIIRKAGLTSIFFVVGFSLIFVCLGASASLIGSLLAEHMKILTRVAGVAIVILGLHLIGILKIKWLNYEKRMQIEMHSSGLLSAFLIGMAFGFGWTPCIGPILAGILALAATQGTVVRGIVLLSAYSMGIGIPFIITGFGVGMVSRFIKRYKKFIRWSEIIAGILLIGVGILIFFNNLTVLLRFVPSFFYKFSK